MLKRNIIQRYFILLCCIAIILAMYSGCQQFSQLALLPVPLHPQETGRWCWAASGQMIMDYLGHNVDQCVQANNRFHTFLDDCCNIDLCPPPTEPSCYNCPRCLFTFFFGGHRCVCGGWPEFDKYGFSFKRTSDAALTWDQVREQISNEPNCKATPFAFSWHWPGGGGHMMVAAGYGTLNEVNFVVILDPWSPCVGDERIINYNFFDSSPGHHTHWDDFYDIKYIGGD